MTYNVQLSLPMIIFDLVLLYYMHFAHRSTAPYHKRMKRALLILAIVCVIDLAAGILSLHTDPDAVNRSLQLLTSLVLVVSHLGATILVALYLLSFLSDARAAQKDAPDAPRLTTAQKLLIALALPGFLLALLYEIRVNGAILTVPFYLSLLTYAFFFVTEFPVHDRLRQRLTELEKALLHAREAEQEAASKDHEKNDFLTNMSHEIRTPLNAILGMDETILRTSREDRITSYAGDIRNAGQSLLAIINDILDFSRIESGSLETVRAPYHLGYVLDTVWSMMALRASDKGLRLVREIDDTLPDELTGDAQRLQQVLVNLLNNAIKYTREGTVTLRLCADARESDRVTLRFDIEDTGIGIRKEDLPRLFRSYERLDMELNRGVEGTGLGLTITHNLVRLMGGEIRVDSVYGKGSTFTVLLPQGISGTQTLAEYALAEHRERTGEARRFFAPDARILAVDDTESNLRVVEHLLQQTMISVDTCLSGEACLALLREHTYDVILLDHMMPGMDGIETMKAIRATDGFDAAATRIIVLTANAIAGAREMYLTEGFDDYLSKPVEALRMEDTMMKYLPAEKVITAADARYTELYAQAQEAQAARELAAGTDEDGDLTLLREVTHVDLQEALRLCTGPSLLRTTMIDFAEAIDEESALIEQYVSAKDWKNYTIKVHALKGVARLIGATALSEDARFLEGCGKAENVPEILAKTPGLLEDYRAYRAYLAPVLPVTAGEEDTREEISAEELAESYEALKEFVEMHDFDSADFIMETLAKSRIPAEEQARYDRIRKAVRRLDRDALLREL